MFEYNYALWPLSGVHNVSDRQKCLEPNYIGAYWRFYWRYYVNYTYICLTIYIHNILYYHSVNEFRQRQFQELVHFFKFYFPQIETFTAQSDIPLNLYITEKD